MPGGDANAAMKVDVYMPLYLGDYARDTGDLTAEEHGAYLLIMMAMWAAGGSIPVARLAAFSKVPPRRWPAVWETIKRFFLVTGDMVSQGRLLRELVAANNRRAAARGNGIQGGRPKTHQDNNLPVSIGLTKTPIPVNRNETSSPSPSESDPDRTPLPPKGESVYSRPFLIFWEAYPRKQGKDKAYALWKRKAMPLADILGALSWQRMQPDWTKENGKYIPKPATYLNAGGWKDERPTSRQSAPDSLIARSDAYLAVVAKPPNPMTPEQLAEMRATTRQLAEQKAAP